MVVRSATKGVADTSSSNISERVLDYIHPQGLCLRVGGCILITFGVEAQSMLTDTRNEARLVFLQRGWGPNYPSSRGLNPPAIRLF